MLVFKVFQGRNQRREIPGEPQIENCPMGEFAGRTGINLGLRNPNSYTDRAVSGCTGGAGSTGDPGDGHCHVDKATGYRHPKANGGYDGRTTGDGGSRSARGNDGRTAGDGDPGAARGNDARIAGNGDPGAARGNDARTAGNGGPREARGNTRGTTGDRFPLELSGGSSCHAAGRRPAAYFC